MKARVFTWVVAGLCLATFARGEETLTSHGVRYRISSVNGMYRVDPEAGASRGLKLDKETSLARCDDLIAMLVQTAAPQGKGAQFVRDRIEELPRGKTRVDYSQRHQGYEIIGAGARVQLDGEGYVELVGFQYQTQELPLFHPKPPAALLQMARHHVPFPITGPPLQSDLIIAPRSGEAPARLLFDITFPVRTKRRLEEWMVRLDAVTGELLHSESTTKFLTEAKPAPMPPPSSSKIDDGSGSGGAGGGGGSGGAGGSPPPTITVHVDVWECLKLEILYSIRDGTSTDIVTYPHDITLTEGSSMTIMDRSDPTACSKSFLVNNSSQSLTPDPVTGVPTYTYRPTNHDDILFASDCRPWIRSAEGTNPYCTNRNVSTARIDPHVDIPSPTLTAFPILSIARDSDPNDYLQIPCQAAQRPPLAAGNLLMITTRDDSRFDEVNAFYYARNYIDEFLGNSFGMPLGLVFRIFTKVYQGPNDLPAEYLPGQKRLNLGEGDAYFWGQTGGTHYYDASKFSTVIAHEVTHALFSQEYNGRWSDPVLQVESVEEGLCDYLAASFANNPAIGRCYVMNYNDLRTCANLPQDFRCTRAPFVMYPVGSGATAEQGSKYAQGMIVSGLMWDIRTNLGRDAAGHYYADIILRDALRHLYRVPNFREFGSAVLNSAQALGKGCEVRTLLVAREFPDIAATPPTPTDLTLTPVPANRCKVLLGWSGTGESFRVTWTPSGGGEQTVGTVNVPPFEGEVGTASAGTLKVYAQLCGQESNPPGSISRAAVTATVHSAAIRAQNQTDAQGGTETVIDWDLVAGAPNYRVKRDGSQLGNLLAGDQHATIDPAGCGGTFNYCVEVVDCAGEHGGGPCKTNTRPGTPLAVSVTGPASIPIGQNTQYTAVITGGCGLARVTWYWLVQCLNAPFSILQASCDVWYEHPTPSPLQTTMDWAWFQGHTGQIRVEVADATGATVMSPIKYTHIDWPIASNISTRAETPDLPMRLTWNGASVALENPGPSLRASATLDLFDVAGRRRARIVASGSSRMEFPVSADLARGVYFVVVHVPGGEPLRRTIVLR